MKPVIKTLIYAGGLVFRFSLEVGLLTLLGLYLWLGPRLPEIDTLKDVHLQVPLRVYAADGSLMAEFGEMKRTPLEYDEFPTKVIMAVLAAEDDRFFEHPGVDYQGILRASFELVRSGGERRQGGSTITMQVARNFFLTREKTFIRKFNEIFLALKIERQLSKQTILELYLNKIYLGKRAYGFAAAAQVYYGKGVNELTLAEAATLAGLPKAPSSFNPIVNPTRSLERRAYVLGRMFDLGYITQDQYDEAMQTPENAKVHGQDVQVEAPYVAEMVRTEMLARYGNEAYSAGFEVYTTIQPALQTAANAALREALLEYDRRHGYRGHIDHVDLWQEQATWNDPSEWDALLSDYPEVGNLVPAVVIEVEEQTAYAYGKDGRVAYLPWEKLQWARTYIDTNQVGPKLKQAAEILKRGDIIYVAPGNDGCSWLAQVPTVSGAIVALHPQHGAIESLAGGFDYYQSKFNRVIQAQRQPGSSFKPFIYTAALNKGFTAASIINDAPVVFDAPGLEDTWRPENYSGQFHGPTRLRQALIKSRNLVSIRLLRDIGIGYAVRYVERFGFDRTSLPRDLSLALGSVTLTPLDLASGYTVFANGGFRVEPFYIDYIRGPDGNMVYLSHPLKVCPDCLREPESAASEGEVSTAPASDTDGSDPTDSADAPQASAEKDEYRIPPSTLVEPLSYASLLEDKQEGEPLTLEDRLQAYNYVNEGPHKLRVAPRVLEPQLHFLINTMLRDVVKRGTGWRAGRELGRADLAGKTGTTNDQRDAWFAGFGDNVVTVSWVGFDTPQPLGRKETGARAALPMWIDFMRVAMQDKAVDPLVQPQGIVSVRINSQSGKATTAADPEAMFEYFLADQVPERPQENTPSEPGDPFNPDAGRITEQLF